MLFLSVHVAVFILQIGISLSLEGKYTRNIEKYQIVFPKRVCSDGKMIEGGDHESRHGRSNNDQELSIHFKVNLGGNEETIDLRPNTRILSPAAVLEIRSKDKAKLDCLSDITIKPISSKQCAYCGKVRNYNDSTSALSICNGLTGYIRVKRQTYFIEPMKGNDSSELNQQPHILYNPKTGENRKNKNCVTCESYNQKREVKPNILGDNKHYTKEKKTKEIKNKLLNIETTVVIDKAMMERHPRNELEGYILTVLNIADSLLKKVSEEFPLNLQVVRLIYLQDSEDEVNQRKKRSASEILKIFSKWQNFVNPKGDSHPNHHDVALLFTGKEICDYKTDCGFLGVAEQNGICQPKRQAALCKDNGLTLGYTVAHEIAHTLGIGHDIKEGTILNSKSSETSSIMSPLISSKSIDWSPQSKKSLQTSIKEGYLNCLNDEPTIKNIEPTDLLPGKLYGVDFQCKRLYDEEVQGCDLEENCQSLRCQYEGTFCSNTGIVPASGTPCGSNKWCFDGECIEAGMYPKSINGEWSAWSEWSPCSRSCETGVSASTRQCNSPSPKHGGKACHGRAKRYKICSSKICPMKSPSFRDVQCASFNNWEFPGDGQKHKWKGILLPNGNPCALFCINEKNIVALLSSSVIDGTSCNKGIRDVCIEGVCQNITCDLSFDSDSVEDNCGICHGDGTSCEIQQGTKTIYKGLSKCLASIPQGTVNIKLESKYRSNIHFIVKRDEGDIPLNIGRNLGMFEVPGSIAWLSMVHPNQEFLHIPGPIKEPLTIWVSASEPQVVSYTMGLPGKQREGKYSWNFNEWMPCKAQCGEGEQISEPKCFESLSGLVENKFCRKLKKPKTKKRACNAGPCFPRWLIGEWQECGPCPSDKAKRFRLIQCVRPISGTEEGTEIIPNTECPGNESSSSEHCACIKRQAEYWPPVHRNPTSFGYRNIFFEKERDLRSRKIPEKKITLMQLENENQASMLKQFRENQSKQPPFCYVPSFFTGRFNISFPYRKKRTILMNSPNESQIDPQSQIDDQASNENIKSSLQNLFLCHNKGSKPGSNELIIKLPQIDDGESCKPISYNWNPDMKTKNTAESINDFLTSSRIPLNISENMFKILSENIPLINLQKQNNTVWKDRLQYAKLPNNEGIFNDPKNWSDLARIVTLYKTLQKQSYLQSLLQSATNDPSKDLNSKILLKNSEENVYDSNDKEIVRFPPFNPNSIQKTKFPSLQEKECTNYMQSPHQNMSNNFVTGLFQNHIQNDQSKYITYSPVWMNGLKEKHNEDYNQTKIIHPSKDNVIDFPADKGVINKFKLNPNYNNPTASQDSINFDKLLVKQINDNLHHLSYVDKLRIYDDLHNISNTLYNLLFLSNTSEISTNREQSTKESEISHNQTNFNFLKDGPFFGKYNRLVPPLKNTPGICMPPSDKLNGYGFQMLQNSSMHDINGDLMGILKPKNQKLLDKKAYEYIPGIQKRNEISSSITNTYPYIIQKILPEENDIFKSFYISKISPYFTKNFQNNNKNSSGTIQTYRLLPLKEQRKEQISQFADPLNFSYPFLGSKIISSAETLNKEIPILNAFSNSPSSNMFKRNTIKTYLKGSKLNNLRDNKTFEIPVNIQKREVFPEPLLHTMN